MLRIITVKGIKISVDVKVTKYALSESIYLVYVWETITINLL